jgi:hypothetical protein
MSNFIQITPFMHVEDLERALAFFNGILWFETRFRAADYAYVHGRLSHLAAEGRGRCSTRQSALRVLH